MTSRQRLLLSAVVAAVVFGIGFAIAVTIPGLGGSKELHHVPLLLEVPGYKLNGAGKGPDKPNVDRLKEIRERLGVEP